ncbi:hypothetical protein C5O27_15565 [Gordonia alkanivorans]|nr:hypothetical protein C5O27_15565 [Gordonia alkanivorans]
MPPALATCHVVVDSSCPNTRATESHNNWTTTKGPPHTRRCPVLRGICRTARRVRWRRAARRWKSDCLPPRHEDPQRVAPGISKAILRTGSNG